jgi:hypothetical protein
MTREEIEKRMDEAACKYAETHDEKYKEEVLELARQHLHRHPSDSKATRTREHHHD